MKKFFNVVKRVLGLALVAGGLSLCLLSTGCSVLLFTEPTFTEGTPVWANLIGVIIVGGIGVSAGVSLFFFGKALYPRFNKKEDTVSS